MIQVFMSKRGTGKSKYMISHANESLEKTKGHLVFIDDDGRPMHELAREIRFINTDNCDLTDMKTLYGFICGILAQDYDVDQMYVDGILNKMDLAAEENQAAFEKLEKLSDEERLTIYFAVHDSGEMPEYLQKNKVEVDLDA